MKDDEPLGLPRNVQQLRNLRFRVINSKHLSRDSLYNLHELGYDIPGFVWKVTTLPDLACVCGMQEMLEEFDRVLLLGDCGQVLSYDTTFQLGDFYVSSLIFRHLIFKDKPCIPVAFLLHERKFAHTHVELFHVMRERVPSLRKLSTIPLVTDGEQTIIAAIRNKLSLPNINLVRCWNHIIRDIQSWLKQHEGKATHLSFYCDAV